MKTLKMFLIFRVFPLAVLIVAICINIYSIYNTRKMVSGYKAEVAKLLAVTEKQSEAMHQQDRVITLQRGVIQQLAANCPVQTVRLER